MRGEIGLCAMASWMLDGELCTPRVRGGRVRVGREKRLATGDMAMQGTGIQVDASGRSRFRGELCDNWLCEGRLENCATPDNSRQ